MNEVVVQEGSVHRPGEPPQTGPQVQISVNGQPVLIHRGHQTVAAIKQAAAVPLADELSQIDHGKVVALPDDGSVVIKGGEEFIAHPRSGGSS